MIMKKIFYLSYLILFITLSCKSQINNNKDIIMIEFTGVSYGKLSQSADSMSLLTKATKINKKQLSKNLLK